MSSCREKTRCRASEGFTLVEVVLATALSAAVMVAVLGVVARMARSRPNRCDPVARALIEDELLSLIEMDLANARSFEARRDGFVLTGFGRIDPKTKKTGHGPARIRYQVRRAGGQNWLVRVQTIQSPGGGRRETHDLVCAGVERIALEARDEPTAGSRPAFGESTGMPDAVRLTVSFGTDEVSGQQQELERTVYR